MLDLESCICWFISFFMIINMMLSYILVGSFYASYSVFLRAALPNSDCFSFTKAANILENLYLIWLFFILMLSTTVNIMWVESFFRITSLAMGLLTLCIVGFTIYYWILQGLKSLTLSIVFVGVILLSYILPLLTNFTKIKLGSFLKGVVYVIYMAPTYINIITIYSFSNISDISWGSRPAGASAQVSSKERVRMYFKYLFV